MMIKGWKAAGTTSTTFHGCQPTPRWVLGLNFIIKELRLSTSLNLIHCSTSLFFVVPIHIRRYKIRQQKEEEWTVRIVNQYPQRTDSIIVSIRICFLIISFVVSLFSLLIIIKYLFSLLYIPYYTNNHTHNRNDLVSYRSNIRQENEEEEEDGDIILV